MAITEQTKPRAPIERTEHPHVVRSAGTLGGEPRVDGTRISVRQIYHLVEAGEPVAEIVDHYPPLTVAQVYDALSYAHDHPDEMAYHDERHKLRNVMRDLDMVMVGTRLIVRDQLKPSDVPPGATLYTWDTLPEGYGE